MLMGQLTESQLQQIEEQVYEIVPVRDAEIRGTYCAARKKQ